MTYPTLLFATRKVSLALVVLLCGTGASMAFPSSAAAAPALPVPIFDSMPAVIVGNYVSLSYEAQKTAEFGDQVVLGGTERTLHSITMGLSSWACEQGHWTGTPSECKSGLDATFSHPITLNIHAVNATNPSLPGALLASQEQIVAVPFRPNADPTCPDGGLKWRPPGAANCVNGFAFFVTYDFSALNLVLPEQIIVTVAYNTHTQGAKPKGQVGHYDSLNVGLQVPPDLPTVGTQDPNRVFRNSSDHTKYGDLGDVNILREAVNPPSGFATGGLLMTIFAKPAAIDPIIDPVLPPTGATEGLSGLWLGVIGLAVGGALLAWAVRRRPTPQR